MLISDGFPHTPVPALEGGILPGRAVPALELLDLPGCPVPVFNVTGSGRWGRRA